MVVHPSAPSPQQQARPWVETPLRESYALSQAAGCRIFLKLETLQPSGSFKSRGIGNYILRRLEELPPTLTTTPHIFCSSGGNAGLAAVHASRTLGLPCTVVLPKTIKPLMVSKIKAAGAFEVLQHGNAWADADRFMREEIMPKVNPTPSSPPSHAPAERNNPNPVLFSKTNTRFTQQAGPAAIYTPPFDHPDIWCGNATLMSEIASQMQTQTSSPADVIICSVGGGGLLNGIMQTLDTLSLSSRTTVLGLETAGAHSLSSALKAGELTTLAEVTSQATSLGCARVTQATFDYAQRANVRSVVLPDAEAAMGCWRLADDERVMVELACGVNVALCYGGRLERALGRKVRREEKVVVVLCGGSNVTVDMLAEWRREYAYLEEGSGGMDEGERESEVEEVPSVPSEVTRRHRGGRERERGWGGEVFALQAKI
ncbi:tryptophan synthase beta subunit-like PLP-dependent enzyme [Byssothecium circinans]|uniref:L-serine ammonia-lyase n=1 Tax=Byssothecium circinans TaxID=147558 RepID=A0A6A5TC85_9PLEO|nr:tryptophan synthase beta subunit-like PLP-dependent enzyme [Byssothecium circinans]